MNHTLALFLSFLLSLTGVGAAGAAEPQLNDIEIKGYKTVELGMSLAEVSNMGGYRCETRENKYSGIDAEYCKSTDTIFGMRAEVIVFFQQGKVDYISVTAYNTSPVNLVTAFVNALGKPTTFIEPSISGNPLRTSYWLSKSGNSISITTPEDEPSGRPGMRDGMLMYSQSANFQAQNGTIKLIQRERRSRNSKQDF